mgnify:CR=1 FL=1
MKKLLFTLFILTASCLTLLTACQTECEVCSFGDWETVTEATCTAEGEQVRVCSECQKEDRQPIEKKEHDLSLKETTLAATCTTEGLRRRICFTCGEVTTSEAIPCGENHPFEWHTEDDIRTNICSECDLVGITEYRYGDAWGYYDDKEAEDLWYWINEQRKASLQGVVDD